MCTLESNLLREIYEFQRFLQLATNFLYIVLIFSSSFSSTFSSPSNIQTEDDEMEMMALREQALKSLINNAKRSSTAVASSVNSSESAPRISNNLPYPGHDQRPMPIQPQHNTMQPHIYNGNNSSSYGVRPFINSQYPSYRPQGFQPINPMMPVVQPHVNVNFHPIPFNPAHPLPMNGGGAAAVPMEAHKYEPTPPARLSPRSAQ